MVQCKDCEYWSPQKEQWPRVLRPDSDEGAANQVAMHCRRHPPQVVVLKIEDGTEDTFTSWPSTTRMQGCGEGAQFYTAAR